MRIKVTKIDYHPLFGIPLGDKVYWHLNRASRSISSVDVSLEIRSTMLGEKTLSCTKHGVRTMQFGYIEFDWTRRGDFVDGSGKLEMTLDQPQIRSCAVKEAKLEAFLDVSAIAWQKERLHPYQYTKLLPRNLIM